MMSISACCITAPRLAVVAPRPRSPRPPRNRSARTPERTAWARAPAAAAARPRARTGPRVRTAPRSPPPTPGETAGSRSPAPTTSPAAQQYTGEDGDGELDPEPRVAERWAGHGAKTTTL